MKQSIWRPLTSGVPWELVVGPVLFNIFINGMNDGAEYTLSKSADVEKLEGVTDAPNDCANVKRDLNRLEKWTDKNLMKFKKGNSKILHLRRN